MRKALVRFRHSLARSPLGGAVRAVGLHRLADPIYQRILRRGGEITVTLANKPLTFLVSTRQEGERVVNATGEMEHIRSIVDSLPDRGVFWDIGANIGMFTCAAAAARPGVSVHAFEPEPRTAARLRQNAARNNLTNVIAHEVALSDAGGEFQLTVAGDLGSGTNSLVEGHALGAKDRQSTVTVQVRPPVDFAAAHGAPPPDVVKCDVEGAEAGVLRGLLPWLDERRIKRLDVEFHRSTLERQGESAAELERMILARGYRATDRSERGDTLNISFRLP